MTLSEKIIPALFALLLPIPSAMAAWLPNPSEMAALPAYCAAKFDERSNPESAKMWRSTMGDGFLHIHHYCAGLNFLNKARGMSSASTKDVLIATVREFDYVLSHADPAFYLRAEILMNRGIALSMLRRNGEAMGNLLKAIELDPRLPRAYMSLADLYAAQKNRSKALATVTEGLRHNPDTKSLQRRFTELGGKLPYPAAVEAVAAPAPQTPAAETPPEEIATPAPVQQKPAEPAANLGTPSEAGPATPPPIGTTGNPYCRFCP